jgi:hypothetical protein
VDSTAKVTTQCLNNNNFGNGISDIIFDGTSSYNALQTSLERNMSTGLTIRFNYTWSKCMADAADDLPGSESNGGNTTTPVLDHNAGRARCNFSGTNSANFTLNYVTPFGKMVNSRFAKALVSDWQISSLTTVTSGVPFGTSDGVSVARAEPTGAGNDHPSWAASSSLCPDPSPRGAVNKGNVLSYINTNCFAPAVPGYLGDVGSFVLTSPALVNTDVSLNRSFPLRREGMALQLRADMFNAFNRTNLGIPGAATIFVNRGSLLAPVLTPSTTAGQITNTLGTSRQFQISARFTF